MTGKYQNETKPQSFRRPTARLAVTQPKIPARSALRRAADLEVGDTAGLEARATNCTDCATRHYRIPIFSTEQLSECVGRPRVILTLNA